MSKKPTNVLEKLRKRPKDIDRRAAKGLPTVEAISTQRPETKRASSRQLTDGATRGRSRQRTDRASSTASSRVQHHSPVADDSVKSSTSFVRQCGRNSPTKMVQLDNASATHQRARAISGPPLAELPPPAAACSKSQTPSLVEPDTTDVITLVNSATSSVAKSASDQHFPIKYIEHDPSQKIPRGLKTGRTGQDLHLFPTLVADGRSMHDTPDTPEVADDVTVVNSTSTSAPKRSRKPSRKDTPPTPLGTESERKQAKKRSKSKAPNMGRCFLTNAWGDLDSAHVIPVELAKWHSVIVEFLQLSLFRSTGLKLSLDSGYNLFQLNNYLHRKFDRNRWLLIPQFFVLQQLKLFYIDEEGDEDKSVMDVYNKCNLPIIDGDRVFTYYLVPHNSMSCTPISRRDRAPAVKGERLLPEHVTHHYWPFSTLGPLQTHVYPHYAIWNAGAKMAREGVDNYHWACLVGQDGISTKSAALKCGRTVERLFQIWHKDVPPAAMKAAKLDRRVTGFITLDDSEDEEGWIADDKDDSMEDTS